MANKGKRYVEKILLLKPDFPDRGRILIRHFIKSEQLVATLIEGLKKVGLDLD